MAPTHRFRAGHGAPRVLQRPRRDLRVSSSIAMPLRPRASLLFVVLSAANAAQIGRDSLSNFDALAERYGVTSRVALTQGPNSRGLFVAESVKAGEPVLAVPFWLCLVCRPDESNEPSSPWDAPHRDAKDTLLARQLLMAIDGDESMPEELRQFWREWATLLPTLGTLAHSVCLPPHLLSELQDPDLARAATLQQERVDAVLHDAPKDFSREGGGGVVAAALRRWAVAMCSSRPFSIPRPVTDPFDPATDALAAFVPFIDMANHADPETANCEVQGALREQPILEPTVAAKAVSADEEESSGDDAEAAASDEDAAAAATEGSTTTTEPAIGEEAAAFAAVGLVATRDLQAGEEVLISYFDGMPNAHIFSRFGFVPWGGNRHDRLLGLPAAASLLSLPLTREPSPGGAAEAKHATAILQWLKQAAADEFSTSREDDEAMLDVLQQRAAEGEKDDEEADGEEAIMACVLAYRVQRKKLWEVAIDVLEAHVETHSPTSQEAAPQKVQEDAE